MHRLAEFILYGSQIATGLFWAGPVIARAERQRTLARNPGWIDAHVEFLAANRKPALAPLWTAGTCLIGLAALAAWSDVPAAPFAVHGPLFLLAGIALILYYRGAEIRLRRQIPQDSVRRAHLAPRTLSRFTSIWPLIILAAMLACALAVNACGLYLHTLRPDRFSGNVALLLLIAGGAGLGIRQTIKRRPYNTGSETDDLGRRFELRMVLAAAYFFAGVSLYHAAGSWGAYPLFPQPPTMLHAWLERSAFSWDHFLHDWQYRAVDYSATVFFILLAIGIATNRFYRKILAVDFRWSPRAAEI